MADTNTTKPYVPVWEKYALTIKEPEEAMDKKPC